MTKHIAEVELKTPAILVKEIRRNLHTTIYPPIPGSVLRGALLTQLYPNVYQEDVAPTLRVSPLYPITEGQVARIAHVLVFKRKGKKSSEEGAIFSTWKDPQALVKEDIVDLLPDELPGSIKSVCGKLLIRSSKGKSGFSLIEINDEYFAGPQIESVAISPYSGAYHRGMLYSYETLRDGLKFRAYVYDPNDRLRDLGKHFEVSIGAWRSKGFGRAEVHLLDLSEDLHGVKPEERMRELKELSPEGIPAIALSPIVWGIGPTQRSVETVQDTMYAPLDTVLQKTTVSVNGIQFHVEKAYGRTMLVKGWSMKYKLPKLTLPALSPGSIVVLKCLTDISKDELAQILWEMETCGIGTFACIGLNWLRFATPSDLNWYIGSQDDS